MTLTNRERLETIHRYAGELLAGLPPPTPPPGPEPTATRVTTALEFARALEKGGAIVVAPGAYQENFVITQPTILVDETLGFARLLPLDRYEPPLQVLSSDVAVRGFVIENGEPDRETVVVGRHEGTDPLTQPGSVLFDGTQVVAGSRGGRRGFSLHGRSIVLRNCTAKNFYFAGRDAQAVWINNGPGPYRIEGGYYEASGENILLGGASIPVGVNPTAAIVGATLAKPLSWKGKGYTIKNLFEVKAGVGVALEQCVLDGCWGGEGQAGHPIVLTPRNQDGDNPWVQVDHVVILNNRIRNCPDGYAVNILGTDDSAPSQPTRHIAIEGNLFADSRQGVQVMDAAELSLVVKRNTFPAIAWNFLGLSGPALTSLVYEANVTRAGEYGIWGDDNRSVGLPSLVAAVKASSFTGNVIEHHPDRTLVYPAGNRLLNPGALAALLDANFKMLDGSAGYSFEG